MTHSRGVPIASHGLQAFERDAARNGGYLYTTHNQLSARMAVQRHIDVLTELGTFADRRVLDMGCGDGVNTIRLLNVGRARMIVGVDAAATAIFAAGSKAENREVHYIVGDAHRLPFRQEAFDTVVIQGVLHHAADPQQLVREAFRLAPEVLVLEPNGNNPGLKLIEKISPYHRAHGERSFTSPTVRSWVKAAGARVVQDRFAGFVPIFCPEVVARFMKRLEPIVERCAPMRVFGCAVYVMLARRA